MPGTEQPSSRSRKAAVAIVRTLREAGHVAYFAGGCVRDEALGLDPSDYDVATDARPERVRELFKRVNEVGASFGVMLVRDRGITTEVATFRREGGYTDRRRPDSVEYAGREEDAQRRDFTINALFLDPLGSPSERLPHVDGEVIDLVGGLDDLDAKIVRAVGDPDARLAEDDLRALRAVRFAARLGFEIEERTASAVQRHAGELVGISRERIGDELRAMLSHPSRAVAASLMERLSLARPALDCREGRDPSDRVALLEGLPTDAEFPTALAAWTIDRMGDQGQDPAALRSGAGAIASRLRAALCLSNDERDALAGTFASLADLRTAWDGATVAVQKRVAVKPVFRGALAILRSIDPDLAGAITAQVRSLESSPGGLSPSPLLAGDDLIDLGLSPGPRFRSILDAIYDAQLEGRLADRAQAIELAGRMASETGENRG